MPLRAQIRDHFPFLYVWLRRLRRPRQWASDPKNIFRNIYHRKVWGDLESVSGPGSRMEETARVRAELPRLIQTLRISSLLDIPCGDFYWMNQVDLGQCKYIGGDIVPEIIQQAASTYSNSLREFRVLDLITDPLPKTDAILCRDCLVHLSFNYIERALQNICRSGSTYFLSTTFVRVEKNEDIVTGQFRAINLQYPPFNFPPPVEVIDENSRSTEGRLLGKALGVWEVQAIAKAIRLPQVSL